MTTTTVCCDLKCSENFLVLLFEVSRSNWSRLVLNLHSAIYFLVTCQLYWHDVTGRKAGDGWYSYSYSYN